MPIIRLRIENVMTPETSVAQTTKQKKMLVVNVSILHAVAICECKRTSASKRNLRERQAGRERINVLCCRR